ncbi:MAG: EAL domain-containing protein [Lysobacterales bacterium]
MSTEPVPTSAAIGIDRYLRELMRVNDLPTLGHVVAREARRRFGLQSCHLVWWARPREGQDVDAVRVSPAEGLDADTLAWLHRRFGSPGAQRREPAPLVVEELVRTGVIARVALVWPVSQPRPDTPDFARWLDDSSAAAGRLVELDTLTQAISRLERAERLQRALFAIADMASSDLDMPDMLRSLHAIVAELMYAENFFIVLYDATSDSLRFLYFADTVDGDKPDPQEVIPASSIPNSLTLAMIRSGQAQMGPSDTLRERLGVRRDHALGPDSYCWLGVPLVRGSAVSGAVVVQTYLEEHNYTEDDRALLLYVAQHILTALERKQAQEALEARVEQRTRELAAANAELRLEVQERQRSARLQAALYRIAERSSTADTLEEFYAAVHAIVGELLYARNFYIALVSDDADVLDFPYSVDEFDAVRVRRRLSKGLTEYVLRTGQPLLADREAIAALERAGEVHSFGTRSLYWLGVPLICDERTVGVIAVQSYTGEVQFSERDQELLTFVAFHIANGLERKRAQDSLRLAYADLERRVADRTHELAVANRELTDQIQERERIEDTLKHQALHDTLTGLPNRAYLLDRLGAALARFRRGEVRGFAVLFLDLDRFKVVNDSVGHLVGDELLKTAAARLVASVQAPDVVARLGGDEFAILLDDLQHPDRATFVAERLISTLSEAMRIGGKELFTSASVGIAFAHPRYLRAEELLRDADVAMYRAKSQGRQRFELFDERLRAEALRVLDLEGDLRRALARGEFEPHFQAIVRLADSRVVGYEALLRWRHNERGLLLPGDFLTVAEDNGSIEQIDWQMFALACRDAARLPEREAYICINVSARQLRAQDFDRSCLKLIEESGLAPGRVRIEVTEGALLDNPDHVRRLLERLRDAGVYVQLDDFGTGYSSLSYLHRFPIHSLKIDRSFVSDLRPGDHGGSAAVVRAIHALADSLKLEVIGEGIETHAQCRALMDLGCTLGQGYLFARPLPVEELARGK